MRRWIRNSSDSVLPSNPLEGCGLELDYRDLPQFDPKCLLLPNMPLKIYARSLYDKSLSFQSVCLSFCLSVRGCLSICPSARLSIRFPSVCLSVCLHVSVCMSISQSACRSICLSIYSSVCLSVQLPVFLPVCLFVSLFVCLSTICLSVCLPVVND